MEAGRRFYKLTGSGNDFVFFDGRDGQAPPADAPRFVADLCARGTGVGADGVVWLTVPERGVVEIVYRNSDGSRASLCGNATLCTARLAAELGIVPPGGELQIRTDAGQFRAWAPHGGDPAFELRGIRDVTERAADVGIAVDELAAGYAVAGVPHLVMRVADVDRVDVGVRGAALRPPTASRPAGANVNFVAPGPDGRWGMRTYERGVEAETLACGTGAVAVAVLLRRWGLAGDTVAVRTRAGRLATVRLGGVGAESAVLAGEGRLVYVGELRDVTGG